MQPEEHPPPPQSGWDPDPGQGGPSAWEDAPAGDGPSRWDDTSLAQEQAPLPVEAPATRRRALPVATVALAIAVAALAGFLIGHRVGVRAAAAGRPTFAAGPGGAGAPGQGQARRGAFPGGGAGGGAAAGTAGTVKSVEGDTIFLTDADGNTTKVTTSGATSVTKTVPGTLQDVKPGDNVLVQGTRNDDGSYTANRISVGGIGAFFGGFRGGQRGPGSAPVGPGGA